MTTRSTFKIEDPSLGPGRVDFRAPDEGFGFEGPRNPGSTGAPPPKNGYKLYGGYVPRVVTKILIYVAVWVL